jgi:hypothetical protein
MATLGGINGVEAELGWYTAWRLSTSIDLIERDGMNAPWATEYWMWLKT